MSTGKITGTFSTTERHEWITKRLRHDGRVDLAEVAEHFEVSVMTVRRDLVELEAAGVARRVRGGAVLVGPMEFQDRNRQQVRAKTRIAEKLLPLVPATGSVFFDSSSTVLRLASVLVDVQDLYVLTNGLQTFAALQGRQGCRAVLTGGEAVGESGVLAGHLACQAAESMLADQFFTSATSVDPVRGASELSLEGAQIKAAMARSARRVILAADASKLGTRAVSVALTWDRVDLLVTELDPGDARLDPYRDRVDLL